MYTNIEFFDKEPIENVITCLNFKMDRVIFFGYDSRMTEEAKKITGKALKDICHVTDVVFVEVSQKKLSRILEVMERYIDEEVAEQNQCFFDMTGGEDMILMAMGMLKERRHIPVHQFDIRTGGIRTFDEDGKLSIVEAGIENKISLKLNDILKLRGASIADRYRVVDQEALEDEEFQRDVERLWEISRQDEKEWNRTADILKNFTVNMETETVSGSYFSGTRSLHRNQNCRRNQETEFRERMELLEHNGMIYNLRNHNGLIIFQYKNEMVWECLTNPGTVLELHTYFGAKEDSRYSDCRTGVQIDWDGALVAENSEKDNDVENEVDVMLLKGYVPVFISCKNGKANQMALYELDTVASRFGGKYAEKYLVVGQPLCSAYKNRAEEMGITVVEAF